MGSPKAQIRAENPDHFKVITAKDDYSDSADSQKSDLKKPPQTEQNRRKDQSEPIQEELAGSSNLAEKSHSQKEKIESEMESHKAKYSFLL